MNLDDFSDCSPVLSPFHRGLSPVIFHSNPKEKTSQQPRKSVSKENVCFSRQMAQTQIHREHVAAVEERLKQHPLAMYPYYKDHMTPELFDKVVSILEPDMCVNSASALPKEELVEEGEEENCPEPRKTQAHKAKQGAPEHKISADIHSSSPLNGNVTKKSQMTVAQRERF